MSEEGYYLFKGLLVFGGLFAFLFWQLWDVDRDIKRTKQEDAQDSDA